MAHSSFIDNPPLKHLDYNHIRNVRPDFTSLPIEIGQEFQAALDGMRQELKEALCYKVVHTKAVTLRAEPSVYSEDLGRVTPGELVRGFPVGSWLLVTDCSRNLPADGAWVMVDGAALGVGSLLAPEWSQMSLQSIREGVHVQWPGIKHSDSFYYLQCMPEFGIEGIDGSTVFAKQPKDAQDDVVAIVSGPLVSEGSKVKLRAIARLNCGLLVGTWQEHIISNIVDASSLKLAQVVPKDALAEESDRYNRLVGQLALWHKKKNFQFSETDALMNHYKERPKDSEEAKEKVLTALFGKSKEDREGKVHDAVGHVQDMFAGATGVYEEGISGECNRVLAAVISTLARKHG